MGWSFGDPSEADDGRRALDRCAGDRRAAGAGRRGARARGGARRERDGPEAPATTSRPTVLAIDDVHDEVNQEETFGPLLTADPGRRRRGRGRGRQRHCLRAGRRRAWARPRRARWTWRSRLDCGLQRVNAPDAGRRLLRAVRRQPALQPRPARAGPRRARVLHQHPDPDDRRPVSSTLRLAVAQPPAGGAGRMGQARGREGADRAGRGERGGARVLPGELPGADPGGFRVRRRARDRKRGPRRPAARSAGGGSSPATMGATARSLMSTTRAASGSPATSGGTRRPATSIRRSRGSAWRPERGRAWSSSGTSAWAS